MNTISKNTFVINPGVDHLRLHLTKFRLSMWSRQIITQQGSVELENLLVVAQQMSDKARAKNKVPPTRWIAERAYATIRYPVVESDQRMAIGLRRAQDQFYSVFIVPPVDYPYGGHKYNFDKYLVVTPVMDRMNKRKITGVSDRYCFMTSYFKSGERAVNAALVATPMSVETVFASWLNSYATDGIRMLRNQFIDQTNKAVRDAFSKIRAFNASTQNAFISFLSSIGSQHQKPMPAEAQAALAEYEATLQNAREGMIEAGNTEVLWFTRLQLRPAGFEGTYVVCAKSGMGRFIPDTDAHTVPYSLQGRVNTLLVNAESVEQVYGTFYYTRCLPGIGVKFSHFSDNSAMFETTLVVVATQEERDQLFADHTV